MALRWLQYGTLVLLLALGGCGGGSSDSTAEGGTGGSGSGSGQYAEGGMGGSGSGTSSGYGSIKLNDNRRHYPIDPNADVFLDGQRVDPDSIDAVGKGLPLGMQLEFVLAGDADSGLTGGTAIRIRADHRVIGPVTATDPLEVLGQPVLVTDETRLAGGLGTLADVDTLVVGDVVKVDGLVNGDDTIRATRLEKPAASPTEWQLMGRIDSVTGPDPVSAFTIGDEPASPGSGQVVQVGSVVPDCEVPLSVDQRVLVRAGKDTTTFGNDGVLDTVLGIECLPEGLSLFDAGNTPTVPATLPAAVEGIITGTPRVDGNGVITLSLNGQQVEVDPDQVTEVLFGTLDQLQAGARIEVDGTLDTGNRIIQATRIRFRDPLVEITAPVDSGVAGELLSILGMDVYPAPDTDDADGVIAAGAAAGYVDVQGFVSVDNNVYASLVRDNGTATASRLVGPVRSADDQTNEVQIAGTVFDTSSADKISFVGLTETILCTLSVCLSPPDLEGLLEVGATGQIDGSTWTGTELQQGSLQLLQP